MIGHGADSSIEIEGWSPLDRHFADTVTRLVDSTEPHVWRTCALVSQRTREGHVCVSLTGLAGVSIGPERGGPTWPDLAAWRSLLERSGLVGRGERPTPLVLDTRDRLYLYRYWDHERAVLRLLQSRLETVAFEPGDGELRDGLRRVFADSNPQTIDWQRVAVAMGLLHPLALIVGGPGTGKTYTAVLLLLLLQEQTLRLGRPSPGTLLLAPTGKAAARLLEVVRDARSRLGDLSRAWHLVPDEALTIHRALGASPASSTQYRYGANRQLVAGVVIVDEASMVDLPLMRRLLEAVAPTAHLILLGDADQLSSVEAGAVLSDLCVPGHGSGYSASLARRIHVVSGDSVPVDGAIGTERIRDRVVELTRSRRFSEDSGIGALAAALRRGDGAAALECLGRGGGVGLTEVQTPALLGRLLRPAVLGGFADAFRTSDPMAALRAFARFRVLCAHRRGPFGVHELNQIIESALFEAGLLLLRGDHYSGRPILIEQNDYRAGLFNGDIGMLLANPASRGDLRAFFDGGGGRLRVLSPILLPRHQTAFAMSVHKSQGSEFDHVVLVLPEPSSPLLTRELLYTAVSRAKQKVSIFGSADSVLVGAARRVERISGLADGA